MKNQAKIEDLDQVIAAGEGQKVDFKKAPNKDIASDVCAFLNATGGRIFIGIDDNGKIVGTDTKNAACSKVLDTINNIDPRPDVTLEVCDNLIVVTVPEGKEKPYVCLGGVYLRMGPNSQKLDRRGIYDLFKSEGLIEYDSKVRNEFPVKDNFDKKAYRKYIEKAGISDKLPSERVLTQLRCAVRNENKELVYTNGGALFFRDNAEDSYFRYTQIVCALFKGLGKAKVIDSAHFNGGMLDNIDNAVAFLWKNLRVRHEIKGMQRKNVLEIPEDALREAITNAACHRDYLEEGANVMVEIFDDRVVVHNPGGLPKGMTIDDLGEMSVPRNKMVAEMLLRAGYIERMGTGIKKMREKMEDAGLEPPSFKSTYFFKAIFMRPQLHTLTIEKTHNVLSPRVIGRLSEDEVKVCDLIIANIGITSKELSNRSGFSERKIFALIKSLTEKEIIVRVGTNRKGTWEITAFAMTNDD